MFVECSERLLTALPNAEYLERIAQDILNEMNHVEDSVLTEIPLSPDVPEPAKEEAPKLQFA